MSICNMDRRSILKTAGTALSVPFISATVSGQGSRGRHKKHIRSQIQTAVANQNFEEAYALAEHAGFKLKANDLTGEFSPGEKSDSVQTQDFFSHYDSSESNCQFMANDLGKKIDVMLSWSLFFQEKVDIDGAPPKDGVVIGWEDSQFGLDGSDSIEHSCQGYSTSGEVEDIKTEEPDDNPIGSDGASAVGIKVSDNDLSFQHPEKIVGSLQFTLNKQNFPDRVPGRIAGTYEHTWSVFGNAGLNFLESVVLTYPPLGVNIDTGADSWSYPEDQEEAEAVL